VDGGAQDAAVDAAEDAAVDAAEDAEIATDVAADVVHLCQPCGGEGQPCCGGRVCADAEDIVCDPVAPEGLPMCRRYGDPDAGATPDAGP